MGAISKKESCLLMEGNKTFISIFGNWWYREAFSRFLAYIKMYYDYLTDLFSAKICLDTLFYPWKRDQISYEGLALKEKFEAWSMNIVSRLIGAIVKLSVLLAYLVAIALLSIISLLIILIWFLYPLAILILLLTVFANV